MNEKPLTQTISICISIKTKFQTITHLWKHTLPKLSWERNQIMKAKVIKHCMHHESKLFTCLYQSPSPTISEQILPNVLHEIYKKPMKRTSKIHQKEKTMTHFEMGVACLKNGFLRNSKDYIEEEKEIHYLKLAKQEEEKKMEWKHSWGSPRKW